MESFHQRKLTSESENYSLSLTHLCGHGDGKDKLYHYKGMARLKQINIIRNGTSLLNYSTSSCLEKDMIPGETHGPSGYFRKGNVKFHICVIFTQSTT